MLSQLILRPIARHGAQAASQPDIKEHDRVRWALAANQVPILTMRILQVDIRRNTCRADKLGGNDAVHDGRRPDPL